MFQKAKAFRDSRIKTVHNLSELEEAINGGNFARAMWCGDRACEDKIKELMQATSRVMPFEEIAFDDHCVCCGKKAEKVMIFARAY